MGRRVVRRHDFVDALGKHFAILDDQRSEGAPAFVGIGISKFNSLQEKSSVRQVAKTQAGTPEFFTRFILRR